MPQNSSVHGRNGIMPVTQQKSHVVVNFHAVSRDYSLWLQSHDISCPNPKVFKWHPKASMCKGPNQSKCEKSETCIHMFILCPTLPNFIKNTNPAFKILFPEQSSSRSNHSNGISGVWSSVYWSQKVLNYDLFQNLNYALNHKVGKYNIIYASQANCMAYQSEEKRSFWAGAFPEVAMLL